MGWMTGGLLAVVLLLCSPSFASSKISDEEADSIADSILDDPGSPIKALELLKVTDPMEISDDPGYFLDLTTRWPILDEIDWN